jgi:single-strand DNA-binding protein
MNVAMLRGTLSRAPEERSLPSGDRVANFEITVRSGEVAESVPVVLFDPPGTALALDGGDEVVVSGRVRRRFYRAGGSTQSRTEVVAERIVPITHTKRVMALLDKAVEAMGQAGGARG